MVFGNVMVGQSGGPTAVINSSLAGVFKTAIDCGCKKVYGMVNGIQGLSQNNYIDMSDYIKSNLEIELLKRDYISWVEQYSIFFSCFNPSRNYKFIC